MLRRSSFPYRDLDLSRSQDWLMMDNLKIKICTLEMVSHASTTASELTFRVQHMVANTAWDFYVLRSKGLTQKFMLRTYDENILAPLVSGPPRMGCESLLTPSRLSPQCFFDTRIVRLRDAVRTAR